MFHHYYYSYYYLSCLRGLVCREHFLWAFTACSSRSFPQTLVQQPTATTSAHADPYDLLEVRPLRASVKLDSVFNTQLYVS